MVNPPKLFSMHYVYILQSDKDKQMYIGCTADLKKRVILHNKGNVPATKKRIPLKLIFYEAFLNRDDAFTREKWLKTGWGHNHIYRLLTNSLKSFGG